MRYLTVDGMMSGSGVRDSVNGGFIDLMELRLSRELLDDISKWLKKYESAHLDQYRNQKSIRQLDSMGIELSKRLMDEIPDSKVEYYSDALCRKIYVGT